MLRKRAWHEQESRRSRGLKALLKAVVGIGLPVVVLIGLITYNTARPGEQPPPPTLAAAAADAGAGEPDGRWDVSGSSWVGYRILEEIPRLRGKYEAVGRTPAVDGTLVVDGSTIVEADVAADLRELSSDQEWRELVLRNRYLHTNRHPRASFELTESVTLLGLPEPGEPADVVLPGALTLHGVTRDVDVPLRVRWDGDRIRAVGQFEITLGDYGIDPPRIHGFRLVDPVGDIELDLEFTPAGTAALPNRDTTSSKYSTSGRAVAAANTPTATPAGS